MGESIARAAVTFRERLAIRILGLVTWALPADHRALLSCHNLAAEIEHPPEGEPQ